MTLFQIVALYVALHLLLLPVLMMRVGSQRMNKKVSLGDGGDAHLLGRIRAHANFAETTPFALIGLIALAMMSAAPLALHIFGGGFLLGRILHAWGMGQDGSNGKGRGLGAMLSLLTFLGQAIYLLFLVFRFSAVT